MPLTIDNRGRDNVISYQEADAARLHGEIRIGGSRNSFTVGRHALSSGVKISLGNRCTVQIGENCNLGNLLIHAVRDAQISIGSNTIFNGFTRLLLHEKGRIDIGAGCLFASEIDVTVSDMHSIIDVQSRQRINPARDVTIEDRVWIGQRTMILKGSHIEAGSIIGAAALVTGHVAGDSLATGVPARVVRSGVTWEHKLL
jgi:acetyltransferase-like isoleucine patch superfamily enzyme